MNRWLSRVPVSRVRRPPLQAESWILERRMTAIGECGFDVLQTCRNIQLTLLLLYSFPHLTLSHLQSFSRLPVVSPCFGAGATTTFPRASSTPHSMSIDSGPFSCLFLLLHPHYIVFYPSLFCAIHYSRRAKMEAKRKRKQNGCIMGYSLGYRSEKGPTE